MFRVGGVMLRVTKVDSFQPQPFTVLGWAVPDLTAVVTAFTTRGVAFTSYVGLDHDPLGIWTAPNGDRIAWFRDPDGNTLSPHPVRLTPAVSVSAHRPVALQIQQPRSLRSPTP